MRELVTGGYRIHANQSVENSCRRRISATLLLGCLRQFACYVDKPARNRTGDNTSSRLIQEEDLRSSTSQPPRSRHHESSWDNCLQYDGENAHLAIELEEKEIERTRAGTL